MSAYFPTGGQVTFGPYGAGIPFVDFGNLEEASRTPFPFPKGLSFAMWGGDDLLSGDVTTKLSVARDIAEDSFAEVQPPPE